MKIKIGDRVSFLNDVGGGVVTAYLDNNMVEVETDDGFELPVLATELLRDNSSGYGIDNNDEDDEVNTIAKPKQSEESIVTKTEDYRHQKFSGEAFLAIVPENDKMLHVSDLKLYLINDSNYSIYYTVSHAEGSVSELLNTGLLEPDTKILLKQYGQSTISKVKTLRLQAFFIKSGLYDPQPALDVINSIEGMSFYKTNTFSANDYFNSNALVFKTEEINMEEAVKSLSQNDLLKIKQSKDPKPEHKKEKKKVKSDIEEVDLHIEEIIDNHANMSNGEIVDVQLARFETALNTALNSKTKRIVFIHGVGNGKLKHELRKKLDRKYPQLRYHDASFKEYGYGATMVNLR